MEGCFACLALSKNISFMLIPLCHASWFWLLLYLHATSCGAGIAMFYRRR